MIKLTERQLETLLSVRDRDNSGCRFFDVVDLKAAGYLAGPTDKPYITDEGKKILLLHNR